MLNEPQTYKSAEGTVSFRRTHSQELQINCKPNGKASNNVPLRFRLSHWKNLHDNEVLVKICADDCGTS